MKALEIKFYGGGGGAVLLVHSLDPPLHTSTSLCNYNVTYRTFNDEDFQIQLFSNNNVSYISQNIVYV